MHIIIFAAVYHPFKGGYTESIHELIKRLVYRGYKITVITCNTHRAKQHETIDGVQVVRLPCFNPSWLNNSFPIPLPTLKTYRLIMEIFRSSPDLISTQTRFFPTSWIGFFISRLKKIPSIHVDRGSTHSISSSKLISWIAILIDHTFGWLISKYSNVVIGVSDASCKFLKHIGAPNPVKVNNGIDISFWKKVPVIKSSNTLIMTFVGRLVYGKGVQDLLSALALLDDKAFLLNIVGDGPYRSTLEDITTKLNIKENIRFLGEMNKDQIRETLSQTDIFINPSHSEGFPRSVLEAATIGIPILATNVGGTSEILPMERLIPPNDINALAKSIAQIIEKKNEWLKIVSAIQDNVHKNFDWEIIVNQYIDIINKTKVCAG